MDDKLLSCRDCGAMISKNSDHCPKCGAPNYVRKKKMELLMGIGNLICLILAIIIFIYLNKHFKPILHHGSPRARPAAQIRR